MWEPRFDVKEMTALAVATSIDALAVGVTFAFLDVSIASGSGVYRLPDVCDFGGRTENRYGFWNKV